jgi:hypothetical protein
VIDHQDPAAASHRSPQLTHGILRREYLEIKGLP